MIIDIVKSAVDSFGIILVLMLVDLSTGLWKTFRKGGDFTSSRLRNSVNKIIVYFIVILIGGCIREFGEGSVLTMFVTFLLIIEGVSIIENLQAIFPGLDFLGGLKKIINKKKPE